MNSIRQRYAFLSCSETAAVPHRFCLETRDSIEALRRSPRFQKVEAMTCVDPSLLSLLRRRHRPLDFFACFKRSLQLSQYHVAMIRPWLAQGCKTHVTFEETHYSAKGAP